MGLRLGRSPDLLDAQEDDGQHQASQQADHALGYRQCQAGQPGRQRHLRQAVFQGMMNSRDDVSHDAAADQEHGDCAGNA